MKIQDHWKLCDFTIGETKDLEVAAPKYDDYFRSKFEGNSYLIVTGQNNCRVTSIWSD